ncbi:MAG: FeoB-associated Cys-rich membrane protein [Erysipelotrichaceae bacterium]
MKDIIVGLIIIVILSSAVFKIIREKRRGNKCIGCAHGKSCKK